MRGFKSPRILSEKVACMELCRSQGSLHKVIGDTKHGVICPRILSERAAYIKL